MAPSFDCVSSLLCTEDNIIFDYNDYESTMGMPENSWHQTYHRLHNRSLFFDDVTGFPLQSDECLAIMMEKECHHMPAGDYLNKLRTGVHGGSSGDFSCRSCSTRHTRENTMCGMQAQQASNGEQQRERQPYAEESSPSSEVETELFIGLPETRARRSFLPPLPPRSS